MQWEQHQSVSRADIESEPSSSEPTSSDEAAYLKKLSEDYGTLQSSNAENVRGHCDELETDAIFEFRLFSKPQETAVRETGGSGGVQRVALRSPTPVNDDGGFVIKSRPHWYYYSGELSDERVWQYRQAAVSGERILVEQNTRWLGCELPWRVTVVASIPRSKSLATAKESGTINNNRKRRKGKKSRIAIRKRHAELRDRKEAEAKQLLEKEEAERAKKTNRNREKKVKRRQKKRESKAAEPSDEG